MTIDKAAIAPCGHERQDGNCYDPDDPQAKDTHDCSGHDQATYDRYVEALVDTAGVVICTDGCAKDEEPGHHDYCMAGPVIEALAPFQKGTEG